MPEQMNLPALAGAHEWYDDVPRSIRRQAVIGLTLMAVVFGGFGVWAFSAPLAAAVIAQGSFVATGRNKIVQHLEGGIIKEILVGEGDRVAAGDTLLLLDETLALATERELLLRQTRLEATEARLLAEYNESASLVFPQHLLERAGDPEVAAILDSQSLAFRVTRAALDKDITLLERNIDALEQRERGYTIDLEAHRAQVEIFRDEHRSKLHLYKQGLTRKTEVNALDRAMAEAEGQIGRLEAEIAEIAQMRLKHATQIERTRGEYSQAALDELQLVQAELESIREKARKAENVLGRVVVTAPVSGTVIRLHYHTAGGVIESGKPILEILPSEAPLIIEALIPRTDIDTVHPGQPATVRLSALNQRTTPVLAGEVFYVSADAITDRSDGELKEVYVARISLSPDELDRVRGFVPTPGMPAEIMIQTEERTFAQYIAKPIVDSMSRAFREQ